MRALNPNTNMYYQNGNGTGKVTNALRQTTGQGASAVTALQLLITTLKNVATADGTVATLATALGTVETQLATPATLDKVLAGY